MLRVLCLSVLFSQCSHIMLLLVIRHCAEMISKEGVGCSSIKVVLKLVVVQK